MRSQKGFTLIEMLLVIVLVVIASGVIVNLFIGQNRLSRLEMAELNITNDARTTLDDVDNYVRSATRVVADHNGYNTGADTLVLQIQSVNASNQLVGAAFDHVVFYLDGTNLYREVFPHASSVRVATVKKLANNVNGLAFTYDNPNFLLAREITTDLTLEEDAGMTNKSITVSSKSTLRNY